MAGSYGLRLTVGVKTLTTIADNHYYYVGTRSVSCPTISFGDCITVTAIQERADGFDY